MSETTDTLAAIWLWLQLLPVIVSAVLVTILMLYVTSLVLKPRLDQFWQRVKQEVIDYSIAGAILLAVVVLLAVTTQL